jgi:hypothetical protein
VIREEHKKMEGVNKPTTLKIKGNINVSWSKWYQSFETYLSAADLDEAPDKRKIALLINLIGEDGLEIFNNFTWADADDKKKFNLVVKKFEEYCSPIKNVIIERFNFNSVVQRDGETFESFLTELRNKASTCEFGILNEGLIRDRIVFGIQDKNLQKRLLREPNLSLKDCIEYCLTAEHSERQVKRLQNTSSQVETIKKVPERREQNLIMCTRCNRKHEAKKCPAFGKNCLSCGGMNHFSVACRKKNTRKGENASNENKKNTKRVQEVDTEDTEEEVKYVISEVLSNKSKCWISKVRINNVDINFKLDTGAEVNIIPINYLNKVGMVRHEIVKTKTTLLSFGNFKTKPIGKVNLNCKLKNVTKNLEFIVVDFKSLPILGLTACTELNLVHKIDSCEQVFTDLSEVFGKYKNVFTGTGKVQYEHHIELDETVAPVVHPPRRVPLSLHPRLKKTLEALEKQNIIAKVDHPTDWVNSLVIVEKKNGDLRLCLDPKHLNKAIKREHFMIPTAQDIVSRLSGKRIFSVIDMSNGFWQVPLDKESADLCTFNTCFGRYQFTRLPFGIKSAPEIFQKCVVKIFGHIKGVYCIFDDLIIAAENEKEHDEILREVLETANKNNVTFNKNKIQFKINSVKYMGHVISDKGLLPDPKKVIAITQMPQPQCKKEVKRFLGMINHLSIFIPNVSQINAPLRELVKHDVLWHWDRPQREAFNQLKQLLIKAPVMQYFDPSKKIVIQTDASKSGLGCCLLQDNHPTVYSSRSLSECEQNYAQIEKELLAIVYSLEKFHYYTYGQHVEIQTDHKPLLVIVNKDITKTTARLQRLLLRLLKYNFSLTFVAGKHMHIADTLSRGYIKSKEDSDSEIDYAVHSIRKNLAMSDVRKEAVGKASEKDMALSYIIKAYQEGWPEDKSKVPDYALPYWKLRHDISVDENLVFMNHRLIIPPEHREEILEQLHKGHQGIEKCKMRARSTVYWPKIDKDIEEKVARSYPCQKFQRRNTKESLIPHEIPDRAWKKICADIMNFKTIDYLVVIDYFSN